MSEVDVGIVGTGIAAFDCAARLSAAGVRVSLHEAERPRRATDGLGLVPVGADLRARLDASPIAEHMQWAAWTLPPKYRVTVPGGMSVDGPLDSRVSFLDTDRTMEALYSADAVTGVERAEAAAIDVRFEDGRWTIEDRTGEWRLSHVVFASSPTHPWAERFGVEPASVGEREILAVAADAASVEAIVDLEIGALPGGCVWVAPIGGRLLAGFVSPRFRTAAASRILQGFLARRGLGERGTLARRRDSLTTIEGGVVPIERNGIWIGHDRSHVDPVTGAGLATALDLARDVAERIATGGRLESFALPRNVDVERTHAARLADALYAHPARFVDAMLAEPDVQADLVERLVGEGSLAGLFGGLRPTKARRVINRIVSGA